MIPRRPPFVGARLRTRVLAIAFGLLVAACGPAAPTPSPSGSPAPAASPTPLSSEALAAIYAEINGQVQAIRGLEEKSSVVPVVISPAELSDVVAASLETEMPAEEMAAYERLYKAMGLLAQEASLDEVYTELLESQVAGLYDPLEKKLYVVSKSGGIGPIERSTYAHEYEHALQDQHFDFGSHSTAVEDDSDKATAWQSVFEGDAYTLGTFWMLQELNPIELMDLMGKAQDPEAMAVLDRLPPIVINQVLFAAVQGTFWITDVYTGGGWEAVDDVFRDPPTSTEQILHPEKWASREAPVAVDLPDDLPGRLGAGWSVALEDTFGEQQFAVWLTGKVELQALLSPSAPPEAAAGWGGDRLALLHGPDEQWAVVVSTAWDTARDATEFEAAIEPLLADAGGPAAVLPGDGGTVRWILIASDDDTLGAVATALGLAG